MRICSIALSILVGVPAFASKPVVARHDLTFATGTGIEDIQMLFGGENEQISGIIDKKEVRRTFLNNMLGVYRCYSEYYHDAKLEGELNVHFTLKPGKSRTKPTNIKVSSAVLSSKDFTDCVEKYWSKIRMPAPTEDTISEVTMPILARLRATDSLDSDSK